MECSSGKLPLGIIENESKKQTNKNPITKLKPKQKKSEQNSRSPCPKIVSFLEFLHLFSASQIRKLIPLLKPWSPWKGSYYPLKQCSHYNKAQWLLDLSSPPSCQRSYRKGNMLWSQWMQHLKTAISCAWQTSGLFLPGVRGGTRLH